MDYHELQKTTVGKLCEMAAEYDDIEGATGMPKDKLVNALAGKLGIEIPHKVVSGGIDKSAVKAQIKALKTVRDDALAAKDSEGQRKARKQIHRLRHQLRRAIRISG